MSELLATIDIGTNTALLLISAREENGLKEIFNAAEFVRLGEGMDASGTVGDAALSRLRSALSSHMSHIRRFSVTNVIVTGTSASRDASDAYRIKEMVLEITGTDLWILSGEEEAHTTFLGAVSGINTFECSPRPTSYDDLITVIDVGGGSTEIVQGNPISGDILFKKSLNMGSVRMTERFFTGQPVSSVEIGRAQQAFTTMMEEELTHHQRTSVCVGASGTAVLLGLIRQSVSGSGPALDSDASEEVAHRRPITLPKLQAQSNSLLGMTRSEVLSLEPLKMKGREDVFPAGVFILSLTVEYLLSSTLLISPFGVRHGVALREFARSH